MDDKQIPTHTIAIGIIRFDHSVVVGCRAGNQHLAGFDEFPGGKTEPGESPAAAVVRECFEETGLPVRITQLRLKSEHDYPDRRLILHFYDCEPVEEKPAALKPPFRWVEIKQVHSLRFPEANEEVLRTLVTE